MITSNFLKSKTIYQTVKQVIYFLVVSVVSKSFQKSLQGKWLRVLFQLFDPKIQAGYSVG